VLIEIEAHPPYRDGLGERHLQLDLPEGATLRDALTALARRSGEFTPWARARGDEWLWGQLLVHARGEIVRLDDPLYDGERLELLPPIAGG
jgi:molybdopterin converting factor small subunit